MSGPSPELESISDLCFAAVTTGGSQEHAKRSIVADRARAGVAKEEVRGAGMNAAKAKVVIGGDAAAGGPNGAKTVRYVAA